MGFACRRIPTCGGFPREACSHLRRSGMFPSLRQSVHTAGPGRCIGPERCIVVVGLQRQDFRPRDLTNVFRFCDGFEVRGCLSLARHGPVFIHGMFWFRHRGLPRSPLSAGWAVVCVFVCLCVCLIVCLRALFVRRRRSIQRSATKRRTSPLPLTNGRFPLGPIPTY